MMFMPILTRYLSPTDYGIVATSTVIVQILNVLVGINAYGLIGRNYFDNDPESHRKLVSTSIILGSAISVGLSIILLLGANVIEELTRFPAGWAPVLVVVALTGVVQTTYLSLLQARQEPYRYITFQAVSTLFGLALAVFLVAGFGMDWRGRMLAIVSTGILMGLVAAYGLTIRLRLLRPAFYRSSLREILAFGIPLIPHFIGGWLMTMVARLYLNHMATVADTGLFSVAFNVASPIALVVGAGNQAYWPSLFSSLSDSSTDRLKLARMLVVASVCLPLGGLLYGLAARWFLPVLVGPRFYAARNYILWLGLAFAMQGVYFIFGNFVVYSKKTSLIAWRADFLGGLANLLLCPLMIHLNGAIGAGQATFLAFTISTVGCFTACRRAFPMPWSLAMRSLFAIARGSLFGKAPAAAGESGGRWS
jgi:O-antigen/teichoic acid export membrane protein